MNLNLSMVPTWHQDLAGHSSHYLLPSGLDQSWELRRYLFLYAVLDDLVYQFTDNRETLPIRPWAVGSQQLPHLCLQPLIGFLVARTLMPQVVYGPPLLVWSLERPET